MTNEMIVVAGLLGLCVAGLIWGQFSILKSEKGIEVQALDTLAVID